MEKWQKQRMKSELVFERFLLLFTNACVACWQNEIQKCHSDMVLCGKEKPFFWWWCILSLILVYVLKLTYVCLFVCSFICMLSCIVCFNPFFFLYLLYKSLNVHYSYDAMFIHQMSRPAPILRKKRNPYITGRISQLKGKRCLNHKISS